jgi:glycosyltransferase involved in cell wall biosynthesis
VQRSFVVVNLPESFFVFELFIFICSPNRHRVRRVKLLVFAHTPPPYHGQSYTVQLLLEALENDPQFQIVHVNARLSTGVDDIGSLRPGKLFRLVRYCAEAVMLRFRHGVHTLYYVPGNPSRAALLRDWIVMACCRPVFSRCVFHWHAAGLGHWLQNQASPLQRRLCQSLMGRAQLSIVLSQYNRSDAEVLRSERIEVIPTGIPDPCPRFDHEVLPARRSRLAQRKHGDASVCFRLLYLGLCVREKGLYDAVEAVREANRSGVARFKLTVVGSFGQPAEQVEFEKLCARPDAREEVEYLGFVTNETKMRLLQDSDCLLFPTYYSAESFGLVLLEAMAHGLPVIATTFRMIPELLPAGYPGLIAPRAPEQIAARLREALVWDFFETLRKHYLTHFSADEFLRKMKAALLSV